jgi:hypothetical protein
VTSSPARSCAPWTPKHVVDDGHQEPSGQAEGEDQPSSCIRDSSGTCDHEGHSDTADHRVTEWMMQGETRRGVRLYGEEVPHAHRGELPALSLEEAFSYAWVGQAHE